MINALLLPLAVALAATPLALSRAGEKPAPATQTAGTEIVRTDRINLSRSDIARAQAWGLSQTEWRRYQSLMQGIRGSVSPDTISPLEVLGIHARDEAEQRRYAELWAQAMWEDAERILAFQRAYVEAGTRAGQDGQVTLVYPPEWEAHIFATAPADIWRYIPKLTIPVLVIRGEQSDTFRPQAQRRMARLLPDAQFIQIPDAGHLVPMERPDETGAAVIEFLQHIA